MSSIFIEMLTALFPLIIFITLYIAFYIWGRYRNKKLKEYFFDDILNAIDPYIDTYKRVDPDDRNLECRMALRKEFLVRNASAWLILLPRTSFPTMLVEWLFFHSKDAFGIAANFHHKPRVLFEVIPYRLKSAIRKDFEYLVEIDDINTPNDEINNKYLIKSNKHRLLGDMLRSDYFLGILKEYEDVLQWVSVRTDEPHFEFKFEIPKDTEDFIKLVKFGMTLLKYFGKVTEKTKDLPIPVVLKKEPKKLSEKEKKKLEKEREKERERKRKEREKQRKEKEKEKQKQKGKKNEKTKNTKDKKSKTKKK